MMKLESFENFSPYFTPYENWGEISMVKWWHIKHLYDIRIAMEEKYNWPIIIHCCYETSGHSKKSYHHKGMATDFNFKTDKPFYFQYEMLKKALILLDLWEFSGVGCYPEWNAPGFHLDGRGYGLRWYRANGKYYYGDQELEAHLKPIIKE